MDEAINAAYPTLHSIQDLGAVWSLFMRPAGN
jgi:hypothetical protein